MFVNIILSEIEIKIPLPQKILIRKTELAMPTYLFLKVITEKSENFGRFRSAPSSDWKNKNIRRNFMFFFIT